MSELIKVTPKRVKTARIGRKTNQKSSFFRSKHDPKFGVKLGVISNPIKGTIRFLKFLLHFYSYNNSLKITVHVDQVICVSRAFCSADQEKWETDGHLY